MILGISRYYWAGKGGLYDSHYPLLTQNHINEKQKTDPSFRELFNGGLIHHGSFIHTPILQPSYYYFTTLQTTVHVMGSPSLWGTNILRTPRKKK